MIISISSRYVMIEQPESRPPEETRNRGERGIFIFIYLYLYYNVYKFLAAYFVNPHSRSYISTEVILCRALVVATSLWVTGFS